MKTSLGMPGLGELIDGYEFHSRRSCRRRASTRHATPSTRTTCAGACRRYELVYEALGA